MTVRHENEGPSDDDVPVIALSHAQGEREAWDRPKILVYLWAALELLLVTNPWQVSSMLRVRVLRLFGAKIGDGVVFRPRTRVKFPWKLVIGNDCWIGEGVWFHNQDEVSVGDNCVISQDSFLTTGSHSVRKDMSLLTRPITVREGVWVTSRCVVLGGVVLGRSCVLVPNTVVPANSHVPPNAIFGQQAPAVIGNRFGS